MLKKVTVRLTAPLQSELLKREAKYHGVSLETYIEFILDEHCKKVFGREKLLEDSSQLRSKY